MLISQERQFVTYQAGDFRDLWTIFSYCGDKHVEFFVQNMFTLVGQMQPGVESRQHILTMRWVWVKRVSRVCIMKEYCRMDQHTQAWSRKASVMATGLDEAVDDEKAEVNRLRLSTYLQWYGAWHKLHALDRTSISGHGVWQSKNCQYEGQWKVGLLYIFLLRYLLK